MIALAVNGGGVADHRGTHAPLGEAEHQMRVRDPGMGARVRQILLGSDLADRQPQRAGGDDERTI